MTMIKMYHVYLKFTNKLVGGFNPSEKHISQIENLPQIGVNIKHFETTTQQTIREKLWFSAMWSSNK